MKLLRIILEWIRKHFSNLKRREVAQKNYIIAIPVYDGVDLMDIAAPREMFTWAKTDELKLVVYYIGEPDPNAQFPAKPITTRDGLTIIPDVHYNDEVIQFPNLIWVPGGAPDALSKIRSNPKSPLIAYVKEKGPEAEWVTSVCEGAILLASTGLLNGYNATTHHSFYPCMAAFPEVKMVEGYPRYVKDRNRITGGGISSGLDEALFIIELILGTAMAMSVQQVMQYYPNPPVNSKIVPSDCCPVSGMVDNTCS
jgi:cyclohexyl-isocyanide hydratase